jgi:hypothetical protein
MKYIKYIIVVFCALTLNYSITSNAQSASMVLADYSFQNGRQNFCVDMAGYSAYNGVGAQMWPCTQSTRERTSELETFEYQATGDSRGALTKFRLKNYPKFCLDVNQALNQNLYNGIKAVFWDCNSATRWTWSVQSAYKATARLKPVSFPNGNSFCLDIPEGKPFAGVKVQIWYCNGLEAVPPNAQSWSY